MILHRIELRSVGAFHEDFALGPFRTGINVVAAPNESGKSTCLRAAARALFDRHTTRGDDIKALQPAGTELAPMVAVDFETVQGRFCIRKVFLHSPKSELRQFQENNWDLVAEGDQADRRVQELVQSALPGRGATKPEHWGFLGYLWARQGEPATWPVIGDDTAGRRIRSHLIRLELDPLVDQLQARFGQIADEFLTTTGRAKVGGPLESSEAEVANLVAEIAEIARRVAEISETQNRFQQAVAAVGQLEREQAGRQEKYTELQKQLTATDLAKVELVNLTAAFESAKATLDSISTDEATIKQRRAALAEATEKVALAEHQAAGANSSLEGIQDRLRAASEETAEVERTAQQQRVDLDRVKSLLKLQQILGSIESHRRQLGRVDTSAKSLSKLVRRLSELPELTDQRLQKLQEQDDQVKILRARVEAVGISVEAIPERDCAVRIDDGTGDRKQELSGGKPTTFHASAQLRVSLPGWGEMRVSSGSSEGLSAAQDLAQAEQVLQNELESLQTPSLDAARKAFSLRKELLAEKRSLELLLAQNLEPFASVQALENELASLQRRHSVLVEQLEPLPDELALSIAQLEADEARLDSACKAIGEKLATVRNSLNGLQQAEVTAGAAVRSASNRAASLKADCTVFEAQINEVLKRFPDGIEAAKTKASSLFVQAEARLKVARDALPPDFDSLPERIRREAVALQQVTNDLERRRSERDSCSGALFSLGGQGLYSRLSELEERCTEAQARLAAARSRAHAARLVQVLLEHRKSSATRSVLSPLEDRLSQTFATLTGNTDRRVFLDENLEITGVGRARETAHSFDLLSQGAREQLLLCLRIAVALELSSEEPQCLILDDVLVNTDPVRQDRVLDLLASLSDKLQFIILTCHPDRYRGAGTNIDLAKPQPSLAAFDADRVS